MGNVNQERVNLVSSGQAQGKNLDLFEEPLSLSFILEN